MSIATRLVQVLERIARAAARANRDPAAITLVAVTKTHPPEVIAEAIAAGARDLGENRVQEAALKIPPLAAAYPDARWHLIGHLQRNKAKTAAELFDMIHSVDSLRLAETLNRHLQERAAGREPARRLPILLQVNVSGEPSKEGFDLPGGVANRAGLEALLPEVERILALPYLEVRGLMTIAPIVADPEQARPFFRALRELREELARRFPQTTWAELSMGMTDDFEAAIAEGATMVRVGRAIFGERVR
ncbi:MAG: YggS family pyridoxal phosphate-dependent enzyme [Oscillochloridaceae bacterium]|nr:YggS family pyridoxal phosphate-dependent enzyme [Chloroflexaceae bacterium]MDW8391157.1 YggS family pyridoxal phosphate-dependent enzyme [Oscillochloridaceae bacterium]